jgi:hypothetical protein
MTNHSLHLAHKPDVSWIIALWRMIYGGDAPAEQIAATAIASLSEYLLLAENAVQTTDTSIAEKISELGLSVTRYETRSESIKDDQIVLPLPGWPPSQMNGPLTCYRNAKGQTVCVPKGWHISTSQ